MWTSGAYLSVCVGMAKTRTLDSDTQDLVEQLCTRAGMLMEDASVNALLRGSSAAQLRAKVQKSRLAATQMLRLLDAAAALIGPASEV